MDLELKEKIADEIIAMMEEREGEELKKHPKLMAAKVEVEKPLVEEVSLEAKPLEAKEEEEISPEMIQALMDHFKDLK